MCTTKSNYYNADSDNHAEVESNELHLLALL